MPEQTNQLPAVIDPSGELALPRDLLDKAKGFAAQSRSRRTLEEYVKWWRRFEGWCLDNGRHPLPASMDTLCGYLSWLAADGRGPGLPLAVASIEVAFSAVLFRHRAAGHEINTKHPALKTLRSGIRRALAQQRMPRRVKPLTFDILRSLLEMLRPDVLREARDAAVLALACGAALRRSELVGLDYDRAGEAKDDRRLGFLKTDEGGLTVILMHSKASQDRAEDVPIPRDYAPMLCRAVDNWLKLAKVQPGEPVFRGVSGKTHAPHPQSGYVGVTWDQSQSERDGVLRPWRVQARVDGKNRHIGYFAQPYEGHLAYCAAKGVAPLAHDGGGDVVVLRSRMAAQLVAVIVKRRMRQLFRQRQRGLRRMSESEIKALVAEYAGHSPRAGCITSMAEAGVPTHQIKLTSRHKSDSTVSTYVRPVDKRRSSGLKGVAC